MEKTKAEAVEDFKGFVQRGGIVYTIERRRSKTNMAAWYSLVVMTPEGALHPNYSAHILTGRRLKEIDGFQAIHAVGCGYNRGAAIVGDIAQAVYGDERALRHESL